MFYFLFMSGIKWNEHYERRKENIDDPEASVRNATIDGKRKDWANYSYATCHKAGVPDAAHWASLVLPPAGRAEIQQQEQGTHINCLLLSQ